MTAIAFTPELKQAVKGSSYACLCQHLKTDLPANVAAILAWRFRMSCAIRSSMEMTLREVNARITAHINRLACAGAITIMITIFNLFFICRHVIIIRHRLPCIGMPQVGNSQLPYERIQL